MIYIAILKLARLQFAIMSKYSKNLTTSIPHYQSSNGSQTSTLSDSCLSQLKQHQASEDDQYVVVPIKRKNNYQQYDDLSESEEDEKTVPLHKDLRIVQYDLVLASNLMKELNSIDILKLNCYFGRYGQILKIVICPKHNPSQDTQAYVTYKNQLDAAWAIAALKDLKHHHNHAVRVHYGASRYCHRFILGLECKLSGCYFNHSLRENHLHIDQLKRSMDGQYQKVYKLIDQNLHYFVEKEYQQFKNKSYLHSEIQCKCSRSPSKISFPTCKEVIERLISKGYIDRQKYQNIKLKIKLSNVSVNNSKVNSRNQQKQVKKKSNYQDESLLEQQVKQKKSMSSIQFRKKCMNRQVYSAQSLGEYIESSSNLKDEEVLQQKIRRMKCFGERLSDLIGPSQCSQKELNHQMKISEYLIKRIMNRRWQYCSRLSFASCIDKKLQQKDQIKIRNILSKLIDL